MNNHYGQNGIDSITACKKGLISKTELKGACKFNIIKYLERYEHKGGIIDLYKLRDYLNLLIELEVE